MTGSLRAFCRAYASHVGLSQPPGAEVERRLALWPAWARLGAELSAWGLRWLAPAALLGRARCFDGLSPREKDALLERLQQARSPLLRGAFLLVKTITLGACYGTNARS